jgi:hypothetical protein
VVFQNQLEVYFKNFFGFSGSGFWLNKLTFLAFFFYFFLISQRPTASIFLFWVLLGWINWLTTKNQKSLKS